MEKFKNNKIPEANPNNSQVIGFEKKEGTTGLFKIILDGKEIGVFTLLDPEKLGRKSEVKVKQIGYVNISDEFRGKGLGKQFYLNLNQYLQSTDGSFLESGDDTTSSADRVWESLFNEGLVIKSGITLNGKDSFRFFDKNKK